MLWVLRRTRWISLYVCLLMLLLACIAQLVAWFDWREIGGPVLHVLAAGLCGYGACVWLRAAQNISMGRAELGEGCFHVPIGHWLTTSLLMGVYSVLPGGAVPALWSAFLILVLPYLVLANLRWSEALHAALRVLRREPATVAMGLLGLEVMALLLNEVPPVVAGTLFSRLADSEWSRDHYELWQVLSGPFSLSVSLLLRVLVMGSWLLPGPFSFHLYDRVRWRLENQEHLRDSGVGLSPVDRRS